MTAKLPPAIQQKIVTRRNSGARIIDIADELHLSRHTVANYCRTVDQGKSLAAAGAPAAALSRDEVEKVRDLVRHLSLTTTELQRLSFLARRIRTQICPSCHVLALALTPDGPTHCGECGTRFGATQTPAHGRERQPGVHSAAVSVHDDHRQVVARPPGPPPRRF
ncbi:MAG: hypothetical protein FJ100_21395 [Deltaproteobacteria bacterium]|nr:hypothetical protein [Deltaproteobacteria bacterium]